MNANHDEFDPLQDLIKSADVPVPVDSQRTSELARRVWSVHQVRTARMRRVTISATLVGFFVAGMMTMRWLDQGREPTVKTPLAARPVREISNDSNNSQESAEHPRRAQDSPDTIATEPPKSAYVRYCELGDAYLKHGAGIEAAAEVYRQALDRATKEEGKVLPKTDSWLLMALKTDRREEI